MPGDIEREDKTRYRYFPESPLSTECVSQIDKLWWDMPSLDADLANPKAIPSNAFCGMHDIKRLSQALETHFTLIPRQRCQWILL